MAEDNNIFIWNKPFMNYVTAVVLQFNSGAKEVFVKARGKWISRAVDVVEVVRKRFMKDIEVDDINISSEKFKRRKDGKTTQLPFWCEELSLGRRCLTESFLR